MIHEHKSNLLINIKTRRMKKLSSLSRESPCGFKEENDDDGSHCENREYIVRYCSVCLRNCSFDQVNADIRRCINRKF